MTAVVAVRAGSQRVKNKNLQDLGGVTLLERKLYNLLEVQIKGYIDNIIVNSDSDEMLEIAKDLTVDTHKREEYYASSECTNSEFHRHIGEVTESEDIFLAPVCSPFVSIESHIDAIKLYKEEGYDSLTSVAKIFLMLLN